MDAISMTPKPSTEPADVAPPSESAPDPLARNTLEIFESKNHVAALLSNAPASRRA